MTSSIVEEEPDEQAKYRYFGVRRTSDRKVRSGVYEVILTRNHCWRNIRSCRQLLEGIKFNPNRHIVMHMIAELSSEDAIGLYCKRCTLLVPLGDKCIKKKVGRGRAVYYHMECARIVHLL